jgi:hypothetical protein
MRRFSILLGFFLLAFSLTFNAYSRIRSWIVTSDQPIFDYVHQTWFYYAQIAAYFAQAFSYALLALALLIPRRRSAKWRSRALPLVRRGPLRGMRRAIRPALLFMGIGWVVFIFLLFQDTLLRARFESAPLINVFWLLLILVELYLSILGFILTLRMSRRSAGGTILGKNRAPNPEFEFGRRTYTYLRIGWITGLATLASTEALQKLAPYLYFQVSGAGSFDEFWPFFRFLIVLHLAAYSFLCLKLYFWKRRRRRAT